MRLHDSTIYARFAAAAHAQSTAAGVRHSVADLTADALVFCRDRLARFVASNKILVGDVALAGYGLSAQGGSPSSVACIPTPPLASGFIEAIYDAATRANTAVECRAGIAGAAIAHQSGNSNRRVNDGSITRLRRRAQCQWLRLFAGELASAEMGAPKPLAPRERDKSAARQAGKRTPSDTTSIASANAAGVCSDLEAVAVAVAVVQKIPHLSAPDQHNLINRRRSVKAA